MELTAVAATAKAPASTFTGDVYVTPIKKAEDASRLIASLVRFTPAARTNWHSHANEQTGMVTAGKLTFFIGDEEQTLIAGDFYFIPGGVRHKVVALDEPVKALDVFYPIREEYR